MIRNRGPHGRITLLPSHNHAPWRQAFLHLHGPDEPPSIRAFIGGEIGSRLVPCEPVEIGASALKNVNGSDHRALLPGLSPPLYYPGQGEGTDIFMGVIPASTPVQPPFLMMPHYGMFLLSGEEAQRQEKGPRGDVFRAIACRNPDKCGSQTPVFSVAAMVVMATMMAAMVTTIPAVGPI